MDRKKRIPRTHREQLGKRRSISKKRAKFTLNSLVVLLKESVVFLLLIVGCLVFSLRFGVHQVDGRSMFPTFQNGDRIVVTKNQQPQRYDIITFEPAGKKNESYIKRVMGVPGDTIVVEGTSIFLVSKKTEQTAITSTSDIPDGALKINVTKTVAAELADYSKIPEDCYFVEGDNRDHSTDSRAFGLVHSGQIEGIVNWRYFPFNKIGSVR